MANANVVLDTHDETQVIDMPTQRTIYDASYQEIFWKSFTAGVALGLGRIISSLIFFGILAGIFVAYIQPRVNTMLDSITERFPILQQQPLQSPSFLPDSTLLQYFPFGSSEPGTNTPELESTTTR